MRSGASAGVALQLCHQRQRGRADIRAVREAEEHQAAAAPASCGVAERRALMIGEREWRDGTRLRQRGAALQRRRASRASWRETM